MSAPATSRSWTTGARAAFPFSNFEPVDGLELDGTPYPTAEHLFQALKTDDLAWRERVRTARTPATAKRLGRQVPLRAYWDDVKLTVMLTVLRRKFRLEPFKRRLLAWEGPIVEITTWHDQYWGICVCARHGGRGANHLGRLLEELREELLAEVEAARLPLPARVLSSDRRPGVKARTWTRRRRRPSGPDPHIGALERLEAARGRDS